MRAIGLIALSLLVAGCAHGQLDTPSGRPEIFIENASLEEVSEACLAFLVKEGYEIEESSPHLVLGSKRVGSTAYNLLFRSAFDPVVLERCRLVLIKNKDGVTVYLYEQHIINRGSHLERTETLDRQKHYEAAQARIQTIKAIVWTNKNPPGEDRREPPPGGPVMGQRDASRS